MDRTKNSSKGKGRREETSQERYEQRRAQRSASRAPVDPRDPRTAPTSISVGRHKDHESEYGSPPTRSQRGKEKAGERRRDREDSQPYEGRQKPSRDVRESSPTYHQSNRSRRHSPRYHSEQGRDRDQERSSIQRSTYVVTSLDEGLGDLQIEESNYALSASILPQSARRGSYDATPTPYDSRRHDDIQPVSSPSYYPSRDPFLVAGGVNHFDTTQSHSTSHYEQTRTDERVVVPSAYRSQPLASADPDPPSSQYYQSRQYDSTNLHSSDVSQVTSTYNIPPQDVTTADPRSNPNISSQAVPEDATTFDPSYVVRNRDYKKYFTIGRVFMTLWTEPFSSIANRDEGTSVSVIIYGQKVYSKPRRFIVVREGKDRKSATCLPITSYNKNGVWKNGIQLSDHGFVYSKNRPEKVDGLCSKALKVNLVKSARPLNYPSLVNYAKPHNIESHWKVKEVGELDEKSKQTLLHYFRKVFSYIESDQPSPGMTPPRGTEATLAGIGSGIDSYPPPLLPEAHQTFGASAQDFASTAAPTSNLPAHPREASGGVGGSTGYGYPGPNTSRYDSQPVQDNTIFTTMTTYPSAYQNSPSQPVAMAAGRDFPSPTYSSQPSTTNEYYNRQPTVVNPSIGRDIAYTSYQPQPSWSAAPPSQSTRYADNYGYPTTGTGPQGYVSYQVPTSNYVAQASGPGDNAYPSTSGYNDLTAVQSGPNDDIELPSLEAVQQTRPRRESRGDGNRRRQHRDDRDQRRW